jgi:hypothetical protein
VGLALPEEFGCSDEGGEADDGGKVLAEVDVLDAHFDEDHGSLGERLEDRVNFGGGESWILGEVESEQIIVDLVEVEVGYEVDLEIKYSQELCFLAKNLSIGNSSMRNLVRDNFRVERVDVFVLRGQVHGGDAETVDVLVGEHLEALVAAGCHVLVEQHGRQEISTGGAFERGAHLHHPVSHFGPVLLGHVVPLQRVLHEGFVVGGTLEGRILHDLFLDQAHLVVSQIEFVLLIANFLRFLLFLEGTQLGHLAGGAVGGP